MYKIRIPIGLLLLGLIAGIAYLDFYSQSCYASGSILVLLVAGALWEFFSIFQRRLAPYTLLAMSFAIGGLVLHLLSTAYPWLRCTRLVEFYETVGLMLLLILALSDNAQEQVLERAAITLLGLATVYFLLKYLIQIRALGTDNSHGLILLLLLVLVSKSMDIGGYMVGKAFGKHKLCPAVSPKKSWEGFASGMALAVTVTYVMVRAFPVLHRHISWPYALLFAVVTGVLSLLGDLLESLIKRRCQVKDSNSLIPEFGGILDLLDSLIFTAPWAYYFFAFLLP